MPYSQTPILLDRHHPLRAEAEALIAAVYEREFAARVPEFADLLIALPDGDGGLCAAAGLRVGGGFFSEIYLDRPIEQMLSDTWQPPATRDEIAEVTTLAARHPNASRALLSGVIGYLRELGVRFCFFTATERLQMMLKRIGVPAQELAPASAERVANPADWGLYYAANPKVLAIHDAFVSMPATRPAPHVTTPHVATAAAESGAAHRA